MVIFSLVMFLLERLSTRTVVNAAASAMAAVLFLVVANVDARLATGGEAELSSISTVFSLPFLLDVVERGPLTLQILEFLQVYLTFAVIAVSTLLVVGLVHIIYLLHEQLWIKVLHGASLAFFSLPFLFWAISTAARTRRWQPSTRGCTPPSMRPGTRTSCCSWCCPSGPLPISCASRAPRRSACSPPTTATAF